MLFRLLLAVAVLALTPLPATPQADPPPAEGALTSPFDARQLNIRMSAGALHPPAGLVKQRWTLSGYRLGRLGPQAPRAAIIEDDARRRLLVLSATDEGTVLVYRLADLPVDVAARLAPALACMKTRQCQNQRSDPAGELGCLALCLLEHLSE